MKRGDLITIAVQGSFGKPRPAVVIQNDVVSDTANVLVCPLTSTQGPFVMLRLAVQPSATNNLRRTSFVMLSNIVAAPREKCGPVIGSLSSDQMADVDIRLAFILGLAG
ncbi:MAG TPA: type II toxin-antitoxin system PemK/MazF family toxin [Bosea sp. (in: a-proteobacteria)]